ncbi:GNAT family N-acetyltransferase [Sphaerisporangium album]|nr:GNAT family protein [Sphaerisporangium album]
MITVRDFQPGDAVAIASWLDGPEALFAWSGNNGFSWPFVPDELVAGHAADPARHVLVGVDTGGSPVAHLILRPDAHNWSARVGMVLVSPASRGRGHGAAIMEAALRLAFEKLGVHRVDLGVYLHNAAAIRLYERLGFVREGVHREVTLVGGEWWSSMNMSILAHEWRPRLS